jgi:hypothetical protein
MGFSGKHFEIEVFLLRSLIWLIANVLLFSYEIVSSPSSNDANEVL